jgi:hypothetical protein
MLEQRPITVTTPLSLHMIRKIALIEHICNTLLPVLEIQHFIYFSGVHWWEAFSH